MIYLVDDKIPRQKDYGWNENKFAKYENQIVPIHSFSQIGDLEKRKEIFQGSNILLFHESFFDSAENSHRKNAIDIRNELSEIPLKNPNFKIVYFSGSKSSRLYNGNIAHMPVSILYQNLESFLIQGNNGSSDLKYLLFGTKAEIEEVLVDQLTRANNSIEVSIENDRPGIQTFIAQTVQDSIESIFSNSDYNTFFLEDAYDRNVNHEYLDAKVREWFSTKEYDAIFIPLCFGPTLSDFNGLKFATHIRCTETLNQTKPVFIYSFVDCEDLIYDEYFDILKTKNVRLIGYKKAAFHDAISALGTTLEKADLHREMQKLRIDPPENIGDNHSVANEWAILRWASAIDAYDTDIAKIVGKVENDLYFKYLKTTHPQSAVQPIPESELKFNYSGAPKVLYIDDEAEKGWYEIFCKIINDINKISFEHLDDEFNGRTSDEIVQIALNKIIKDDVDVVILDFRLHRDDVNAARPQDVTSVKLVKKIKEHNPGVQVLMFSATTRLWNLQAIQNAGSDHFIYKTPGNDVFESIRFLLKGLANCIKKGLWLKEIWSRTVAALEHLDIQRRNHMLDRDFVGAVRTYLELSFDSLQNDKNRFTYDSAFFYCFLILEASSSQLIDEENPLKIEFTNQFQETKKGFNFQFRRTDELLKEFESNPYTNTPSGGILITSNKRIPYNLKFQNLIDYAGIPDVNPVYLVELRNKFSHPNLIERRTIAQISKDDCFQLFNICINLLNRL